MNDAKTNVNDTVELYTADLAAKVPFADGPPITGYGKHAKVEHSAELDKNSTLKVAFDVSEQNRK